MTKCTPVLLCVRDRIAGVTPPLGPEDPVRGVDQSIPAFPKEWWEAFEPDKTVCLTALSDHLTTVFYIGSHMVRSSLLFDTLNYLTLLE